METKWMYFFVHHIRLSEIDKKESLLFVENGCHYNFFSLSLSLSLSLTLSLSLNGFFYDTYILCGAM